MQALAGILLDVDGTLVDSNDAHAHAWVRALAEAGISVAFARVRRLIGKGGDKLLPEVSGIAADSPKGEGISKRRSEIFQEDHLPRLRPCPGARELLAHLRGRNLRLAVASSSRKDELDRLLRLIDADQWIEARTSADDVNRSKPDPDIVQAALDRLGLPPERVVLLGDTPYDVEAGRRAGVGVVALRCGGWADADLIGALAIYDDPADLLTNQATSPLGRRE